MNRKQLLIFVSILLGTFSYAQEPTKWRGPNSNGIYNETGLLKKWPASGPEIVWHFDNLGVGFSSPVFAEGKIYVSGMEEPTGYIYCLTLEGKLVWKAPYGEEFHASYPGSRASPVIAGGLLYIFSGQGVLTCLDANSGSEVWEKDTFKDLGGENITWGVTETVLVDGNIVYCTPGGKNNNIVAFNRHNGDLMWKSPGLGEKSAYCSPLLIELPSRKLLVTNTARHIVGINASNGKLLWSYEQTNQHSVHANTAIYNDVGLFCFSGYGAGGVKLKLSADGSSVSKEWVNSKLDSRMGGAVLVDGYIYCSGDYNREWRCVDWKTGEEKYVDKSIGKGAIIYADNMLFLYSERGDIAIVEATPEQFKVLSKAKVELGTAQHWAHPVIDDGKLYIRHGQALIAYKIK
ncbi:MAG: PQQ-binding-like beta-propeller repeat protein [Mariniphaga sp.]|nr:PQQ-binding-like beta-propeller repeat protein [Mariniphaga sp.]